MKFAVIGKGKTGSHVIELLKQKSCHYEIFDSKNSPTAKKLKKFDVAICFVNGPVFESLIPTLIDSRISVVTGATGLDFSQELSGQIKSAGVKWIKASNFSIGMNLVHKMISDCLSKASKLFDEYSFNIHEVHHTKKLDAPSGTAIKWQDWSGEKFDITHERIGDVVGDHTITLSTKNEKISLRHEALDRSIFASGALKACELLSEVEPGLHDFEDITLNKLLN
ncbi:4-hydroxy-tetrahydrodipicolinate reductase [Halobacteriovorax sp. HLS]|uniref:4-hydroxy-tetrahydrodipicolinate reductase n=1 Tax=Halobacteriovorax sp. HLS TaxID=2234000 RepID=UPI0013E30421|nr:dihydrodipicolinate reductase C-terminal domain-containing protein [Halobacteriovorax sp. HLS]